MEDVLKYEMIQAIKRYGGGFVQSLAECFAHADVDNFARLERVFPEYIEQYLAMAGIDRINAAEPLRAIDGGDVGELEGDGE